MGGRGTGIFGFGQAAFLGIGGYAYGIIARLLEGSFSTPVAVVLAILISAAGGALAGISGSQYALIILGGFLILVILFVPEGLLAALFKKLDSLWKGGRENG